MVNTSNMSDYEISELYNRDISEYNIMKRDLFGNKLLWLLLLPLSTVSLLPMFTLYFLVTYDRSLLLLAMIICGILLVLALIENLREASICAKFVQTEEFKKYVYKCDYGRLNDYCKLYNNTLCTTSWELIRYKKANYIKVYGLTARLTDEEYYKLSNQKPDSLAIVRGIDYREKKDGKLLLLDEVIKVAGI